MTNPVRMRLVIIESPTKRCSRCAQIHPAEFFCKDKNRRDGRHPWCRSCAKEGQRRSLAKPAVRERQREYQRLWAQRPDNRTRRLAHQKTDAGKAAKRRAKLKAKYGLTETKYNKIFTDQSGICAVCKSTFKSSKHTHIDHCHKTGKVRGILCHNCNRALGAVGDSSDILLALISYLGRAQCSL